MTELEVGVIGAGMGGVGTGLELLRSGERSFLIFDKASRIGGTWRDNAYPGACCDAPAVLYWYSLASVPAEEQPEWTHVYPRQSEILANLEQLAARHGVLDHCRLGTEVTAATWTGSRWRLDTSSGVYFVRYLVCATGQLSRPVVPALRGAERFTGPQFHSARWDHGAAYAGKRVALVGSGASAIQIAPAIAPDVAQLDIFQRTPNYILPRMDRAYSDAERALLRQPAIRDRARRTCHEFMEATFRAYLTTGTRTDATAITATARRHLDQQVADPALRDKLWPAYPFGCKRPLYSDDFYPTLGRPNVELVTERVDELDETGIRTADGRHRAVDLIVYATGFETRSVIGPIDIVAGERSLRATWGDFPASYYGVMVSGYPNLFIVYGPNTNLGHNSVLGMHEAQIAFFLACKDAVAVQRAASIEVTQEAMATHTAQTRELLRGLVWSGGCASWYQNEAGDVVTQWTRTVDEYRAQLRFDAAHMILEQRP
jgi:cation diffusion facilitator CzcD-associated flavoprotein CzcO